MKKGVAIALSGGVDSLVAAYILKQECHDLFGIHFTTGYEALSTVYEKKTGNIENHEKEPDSESPEREMESRGALESKKKLDIQRLEKQLDIPIYCIDLKDIFEKEVVSYFIDTYQNGQTPNPCTICNKKIKFGALSQAAHNLGADLLATGHYARVEDGKLLKGIDSLKDQSYFLSMLLPEQLQHALFPLGELTKKEVVAIASEKGLIPTEKKESQDICFIHENSFADFIASKCPMQFAPGDIVTTDNRVVGTHRGLHRYTIGQRRGLNAPGPAPYYVKKIDMEKNLLIVAFKEELFQTEFHVKELNWLCNRKTLSTPSLRAVTRIRYSHKGAPATIISSNSRETLNSADNIKVVFDLPQLSVTPGQYAVFYHEDQVVGGGTIQ